ncbi:MAG: hypothetical protein SangKO_027520 [Sandaracinaceae bacterium]
MGSREQHLSTNRAHRDRLRAVLRRIAVLATASLLAASCAGRHGAISIGPYDASAPEPLWDRAIAALEELGWETSSADPRRGTIVLPARSLASFDLRAQHVLQFSREGWLQATVQTIDGRSLTRWETSRALGEEQLELMISLREQLDAEAPAAPSTAGGEAPAEPVEPEDDEPVAPDEDEAAEEAPAWDPDAFDAEVAGDAS